MAIPISVVIPVYNTEKTLRQCLDSVLTQGIAEIIAVNDASPDHAADILHEYEGRITILTHPQNKGLLSARLTGIRAAKCKYILFVDSDDALAPGVLKALYAKAEETHADITACGAKLITHDDRIPKKQLRKIERSLKPYPGKLTGDAIYQECFEHGSYRWTMCIKLFRTELCRKLLEEIPDEFCLLAEDFCLYSVIASFAQHYESIPAKGYLYLYETGISSCIRKISPDILLLRQSPFQALKNVRSFLNRENASDAKWNTFYKSEQLILLEYFHRWEKCLAPEDRCCIFHKMIFTYDSFAVMSACRKYFASKDETLLETLTGMSAVEDLSGKVIRKTAYAQELGITEKSVPERWHAWNDKIKSQSIDAVVLECEPSEILFWDVIAVRTAGALPVLWKKEPACAKMETCGLSFWLQEDRILRGAAGILTEDALSAEWYRACGRRAAVRKDNMDLNSLVHQELIENGSAGQMLRSLEQCDMNYSKYTIMPAADGESFVPFYRKLNTLFRKLPEGPRKKLFCFLGRIYDRLAGY